MTTQGLRVGVLATADGLLSGRIVQAMLDAGVAITTILVDPALNSARDLAIHEQRTGGRLPILPLPENVPLFRVTDHNADDCLDAVRSHQLDLLVNAGTPHVVGAGLLEATGLGVINCHPGRLPGYRGACAVEHTVMDDVAVANTVHRMTEGVDEGPILLIEDVPLDGVANYVGLRCAVYLHGCMLLARCVHDLQTGLYSQENFVAQGDGVWHRPVDDAVIAEIDERLRKGLYTPVRKETGS